ncbi:MAG TPA: glycosyltransferase [Chroococcidiopsis sp.]
MPLVSVVIPVYNGENTIRETIQSVLGQTFSDFELLIINDGSTDSTLEILSAIADPRLQVHSYPNAGLAASRNRGIAIATGELISFIDADDLWTADKLEAQVNALAQHPNSAIAYSWTNCIDDNGKFLRQGSHVSANGHVYAQLLTNNFVDSGSNVLVRRAAFDKTGGFDPTLKAAEDWDMWFRLAAHYEFVAVPKPQVLYRVSTRSMSTNVIRQETESLKVLQRAFAHSPEPMHHLAKLSFGILYRYLATKALEGQPNRHNGLAALRYIWTTLLHYPAQLRPVKVTVAMVAKSLSSIVLST